MSCLLYLKLWCLPVISWNSIMPSILSTSPRWDRPTVTAKDLNSSVLAIIFFPYTESVQTHCMVINRWLTCLTKISADINCNFQTLLIIQRCLSLYGECGSVFLFCFVFILFEWMAGIWVEIICNNMEGFDWLCLIKAWSQI